jgi:vitamin B12 transporter
MIAHAVGVQREKLVKNQGIAVFVSACSIAVPSIAQEPDAVVVTASRLPQPRSQTLQPVNVITSEDIAQGGQQTLVEVLQTLGGVEVANSGGFGQQSSVFMRGANSGHTLVLVDGIRLNSATAGTTALEHIPLNQIERIEVVPGQLSSLYGSEAIGGVIQIFTKSGKYSPGVSASAGAGGYGTYAASAGVNRSFGNTDFSLNAGWFDTRGFDATKRTLASGAVNPNNNPDDDGYRNKNFSARLAHRIDARNELGLTAFQSDGTTHFDAGPATDDVNHQVLSAYSLYSRNQIGDAWESTLRVGEGKDQATFTGSFPFFIDTRQPQVTWQNNVKLGPGTAIAGAEYLRQQVVSDTPYTQTLRTVRSVFAGYVGEYERHGWQANVREDDNSQFGRHTTGLLGYAYRLTSALRLRVGAGTAFKAPTFNDLYFPFGFGNPDLRPERSRSKEAGVNYQAGANRFSATYFENRITDLIVADPLTFVPQNVDHAKISGTELAYQASAGGWQANAQLTLQKPVNEETGKMLQRRAKERGSLALSKALGAWRIGGEVVASGARFDSPNEDPATKMHGYALFNLTVSYALGRDWSVRARWNNVFDREYELVQNFNTPGSNVFVAVQYQTQ